VHNRGRTRMHPARPPVRAGYRRADDRFQRRLTPNFVMRTLALAIGAALDMGGSGVLMPTC
jgi:hypothetical protein